MSILGPGGLGRIPLASSAAASAQVPANTDEVQANRDTAKLHADQVQLSNRELGEGLETETSGEQISDRDPDGRLPWTFRHPPAQEEGQPNQESEKKPASPDSDLGRALDVDV